MDGRGFGFQYYEKNISEYIISNTPDPDSDLLAGEFLLYVMGPYTAFDAERAFDDAGGLRTPYIEDPLFDPGTHVTPGGDASMELALREVCQGVRNRLGVRAFLATDVEIPTQDDLSRWGVDAAGMTPVEQSIAFAAVSDAVVFIFTEGGRTTGVGEEVGAILGEFNLRRGNNAPNRKPRDRFKILWDNDFSSATVDETPSTYGIGAIEIDGIEDTITKIERFLGNVERAEENRNLPIYVEPSL